LNSSASDEIDSYQVVLNSDRKEFMGHDRVDEAVKHFTQPGDWDGRRHSLQVYIPTRTALVLAKVE
jgi:1,4-alpha-glucan branching enzyme